MTKKSIRDDARGSAMRAAQMMKASKQMGKKLTRKMKLAQERIDLKQQRQDAVDSHQARLRTQSHKGFLFKPVANAWSTVTEAS